MQRLALLAKIGLGVLGFLLTAAHPSLAGVVVSNLSATVNKSGTISGYVPPQAYAQEFTTGSQSVELESIIVSLGDATFGQAAYAELDADNGGLPGTTLVLFNQPSVGSSFSQVAFDPRSTFTLSANTTYWFALSATRFTEFEWQYTFTASADLLNYAVSNDGESTWTIGSPSGPFLIQVNSAATAVPEPSTWAMMLIGFTTVSWAAYRQQKKLARTASV